VELIAGSLLEEVDTGGWCASKLGRGPEYSGLADSFPLGESQ
jgi:hypothetical protein